MIWLITVWLAIHGLAAVSSWFRNPTNLDKELVIQHHEKCFMLGLIALAVVMR